jgi:type I restriction enzyme, S subunit
MHGDYPYYGASGIIDYVDEYIFDDDLILLGEDGANIIDRSSPLAFKVSGKCWINNHAHVIKPNQDMDIRYLTEYLESLNYVRYNTGSAQPKLNREVCESIPVLRPPLSEQVKIGDTAQVWDLAMDLTQRLSVAKEERRKWLIQQLLTGKRRLPWFRRDSGTADARHGLPADWAYPPLGELAEEISLKNGNGCDMPVLSSTKHRGLVDSLAYFGRQIYSKDLSTYKVVRRGQFAYATNHIDEGSIGYQDLYGEALISPMYTVFQTGDAIDDTFLYLVLKTETYRLIFASRTSASVDRRGSLRWKEFSKIHVPLPSLEEQRAIVRVVDAADHELSLLRAQLDALREQKKGLMQRLLTGKTRVRMPEGESSAEDGA